MTEKRRGHYCWSCEQRLPNEKFSGGGHARHLCKACARLGGDELAYRSASRNLERCVTWEGFIRRKKRKEFETFLQHEHPRVRALAEYILKRNEELRREQEVRERLEAELEDEMTALAERLAPPAGEMAW